MSGDIKPRRYLGVALVARRPCGRFSALAWADAFSGAELAELEREYRERGESLASAAHCHGEYWTKLQYCTGCAKSIVFTHAVTDCARDLGESGAGDEDERTRSAD